MDSKLLYNQIKEQLPPMEGVAVKVEDNKMNFYIDGRLEFYVRESGGVSYMPNCSDKRICQAQRQNAGIDFKDCRDKQCGNQ